MRKKKLVLPLVLIGVVVVGLGVFIERALRRKRNYKPPETISKIQAKEGIPVLTGRPVRRDLSRRIRFDGTVHPQALSRIVSKVDGRIESITKDEGDTVEKGELIVTLVKSDLDAAVTAAESAVVEAEENFKRVEALLKEGGVSRKMFEGARAALDAARAYEQAARADVEERMLRAPTPGIISLRMNEPGELAKWGDTILEIVDIDRVEVACAVPEKHITSIKIGMQVSARLDALPGRVLRSKVERINPVADPTSRLFTVTLQLDNPGHLIRPGMYAELEFVMERRDGVLAVPEHVVMFAGEEQYVFVKEGDIAVRKVVEVGLTSSGMTEIASGLSEEDMVITSGHHRVAEGAKIIEEEAWEQNGGGEEDSGPAALQPEAADAAGSND